MPDNNSKKLAHLSASYHYLDQYKDTPFCFCFKLILSIQRAKLLLIFTMVVCREMGYLMRDYSLYYLLVKKCFGGKITYNLYSCIFSWEKEHFLIFSYETKHFAELGIAVSYFALEVIVGWCSAKVSLLQNAILKYSPSGPLVKIFEK